MMKEATIQCFQKYKEMLKSYDPEEGIRHFSHEDLSDDPEDWGASPRWYQLKHCHWMCDKAISEANNWPIDKLSRWLGFVQAILIIYGLTTINKERDETRPLFKKEEE